jgi:hypothetical protein
LKRRDCDDDVYFVVLIMGVEIVDVVGSIF